MTGVSIIVCSYNGGERISAAIQSILALKGLTYFQVELIIVDNSSTDHTAAICREILRSQNAFKEYRIVTENRQGLVYARIKGIESARHEWVLFCDDDNYLFPDYLINALEMLKKYPDLGVLGGQGFPLLKSEMPDWFDTYSHSYAVGPQHHTNGILEEPLAELYGAGSFFRKTVFLQLFNAGYQPLLTGRAGKLLLAGDDLEWCYLAQLHGYKIGYSEGLRFHHFIPATRLSWEYYLKMKTGIAASTALLCSFFPFFRYKNPTLLHFGVTYIARFLKVLFVWFYFQARRRLQPSHYQKADNELGEVILNAKVRSFLVNYSRTKNHFIQLQRVLALN